MNKKIPNPLGGKVPNPFPIRFYATDTYGWADCPKLAKVIWNRIRTSRPQVKTWYGTDLEILSPDSIKLFVYDIADNFHGGIGDRIHEEVITDLTDTEFQILEDMVMNIYTSAAERELERREEEERKEKILNVRSELFGV